MRGRAGRRDRRTELGQPARPDVGVAPFVGRDPAERVRSPLVLLDLGEGVVEDDRVAFELEVVEALLDVDGGHRGIVGHRRRVDSWRCPRTAAPPLTYLSAADVEAAMPPIEERLALAERTLVALVADADLPPKIAVHPRPEGSFAHAMPAHLRGKDADGTADLLGIKWVTGFGTNQRARDPGDQRDRRS